MVSRRAASGLGKDSGVQAIGKGAYHLGAAALSRNDYSELATDRQRLDHSYHKPHDRLHTRGLFFFSGYRELQDNQARFWNLRQAGRSTWSSWPSTFSCVPCNIPPSETSSK